jgi:hypothetical protein
MVMKAFIAILVILGGTLFLLGSCRLWRRKVIAGSLEGLTGLVFLMTAALMVVISVNLYTYDRLTHETPVAEVRFQARSPQHYWAYVLPERKSPRAFDLRGDEWQLDARILKWHGIVKVLGLDTAYRLDRLSGRYRSIAQEQTGPHTVYSLEDETGLDIWVLARRYGRWIPWVDAIYGSGIYMPMADEARYSVSVSATGLLARPANDIAHEAVRKWH